jgi:hypothetical protein
MNNRAPKRLRDGGELQRCFFDPGEGDAEFLKKLAAEPIALAFVPQHRLKRVEFCLGADLQASHLPTVAKTALEPFDDLPPWPRFLGCSTVCRKPFLENGLLPFVKRYLIHTRGDVIPEGLNVIDLLIDGEIVESWRRQRQGMRHGSDYSIGTVPAYQSQLLAILIVDSVGPTVGTEPRRSQADAPSAPVSVRRRLVL